MSWVMVAGSVIMGGIGLISTFIGKKESEKAADTVSTAATDAADTLATASTDAALVEATAATDSAKIASDAAIEAGRIAAKAENDAAKLKTDAAIAAAKTASDAAIEAGRIAAEASKYAADMQFKYTQLGIDEEKRQFGEVQKLMSPWVTAGTDSLSRQRALMGLDGTDAQRAAMEGISQSPEMLALTQQGENALLQQGAATGGLRGGNIQAALGQFRPQMLSQLINQQYSKLAGVSEMGFSAASGLGNAGMQSGSNVAGLLVGQGNALGEGIRGAGNATANGVLGAGNATAGGIMTAAEASAAGILGSGAARAGGTLGSENARAGGVLGSGNAIAGGILGAGQANAEGIWRSGSAIGAQQAANAQAWANIPNMFLQGGMFGYGLQQQKQPEVPIVPGQTAQTYPTNTIANQGYGMPGGYF